MGAGISSSAIQACMNNANRNETPPTRRESRAAVFVGAGRPLEIREIEVPKIGTGEILIDVLASAICGSDVHTWAGRRIEPTPCVLGHEIVGRVVELGEGAPTQDLRGAPLRVGDRVTWTLAASCGGCFFCEHDLPQKCEALLKYGHARIDSKRALSGGFAEYCLLAPGTGLVRVDVALDDGLVASANCALATVAAVLRVAGAISGGNVLVVGCGVLGLYACAMASAHGAREVIGCDIDASRESMARAFGATRFCGPESLEAAVSAATQSRGVDVALELSGSAGGVQGAIDALRVGGRLVVAGSTVPGRTLEFDPCDWMRRMITVSGAHNYAPRDLVSAIEFLETHRASFPFDSLLGERFQLDDLNEAFRFAEQNPGRRAIVAP